MTERRLLIRLGSMGDVVLATAAAEAARSRWGDRCVDVLVKEEWAGLWEGHPAVDRVWSWPRADRSLAGLLRWARRLREIRYGTVFDLQVSPRTRLLLALLRSPDVRRPHRYRRARRSLLRTGRGGPPPGFRVADAFVTAVTGSAGEGPRIHPTERARRAAEAALAGCGPWGLAPGARHPTKRWPIERFAELGRDLARRDEGWVPVFFGPDEAEARDRFADHWGVGDGWRPVTLDLGAGAAGLARLRGLVTNDTGLMHVATAVGTPVVALFGPTVRSFGFAPWGGENRVLEVGALDCRPCSLHGGPRCPRGHFRCMTDLSVARVRAALEEVDNRIRGSRVEFR